MYNYTNQAKIEDYLERVLTAKEILRLPSIIMAAGREINLYTGREWQDINDQWASGAVYAINKVVNLSGVLYKCDTNHTSSADNRPGSGVNWASYWSLYLTASARYFDGNGKNSMRIDDFISISQIDILDSEGGVSTTIDDLTQLFIEPYNTYPKEVVRVVGYRFPFRDRSVKITGIWGSGVLPLDVEYAATVLAATLIEDGGESAEFKKESIEGYSYELNTSDTYEAVKVPTLATLDALKRYEL